MASFAWYLAGPDLFERFAGVPDNDADSAGMEAWDSFLRSLGAGELPAWRAAFSTFVQTVQPLQRPATQPRVFVSHRQIDAAFAEQIAWQATQAGKDYWLDLHDATLRVANQTISPSDPRYALIIAAIIEIALLNCTHVIATHTPNSLGSKWIPYELARAKGRQVISNQAAGWFHQSIVDPATEGEYVVLARICRSRQHVDAWLRTPPSHSGTRQYLGTPNPPPFVF